MASRYKQVWSGLWDDLPKEWSLACCDCGLTHNIEVRVKDGKPQIRMTVDKRATAAYRRYNQEHLSHVKRKADRKKDRKDPR